MKIEEFVSDLATEVGTILDPAFKIEATRTRSVPHSSDAGITFPNLDAGKQATKLLSSCVLYIDIRRSTQLNLAHKPKTVSKLYSAFVRAMTRCARFHGGHVRGIIGDRVMVVFDVEDAFKSAVHCAIAMNSAAQYVINKHFKSGEVLCGIGIDAGNMLVTKTGIQRRGVEQVAYRNLVWLGRPANVASKLTDLANKPQKTVEVPAISTGTVNALGQWRWETRTANEFVRRLKPRLGQPFLEDPTPNLGAYVITTKTIVVEPKTPAILMTEAVWSGFKAALPDAPEVKQGWIKPVSGLQVAGYDKTVYGGDVIYKAFRDR